MKKIVRSYQSGKIITVLYFIDTFIAPPEHPYKSGAENQLYKLASSLDQNIYRPIVVQMSPSVSMAVSCGMLSGIELYHFPVKRIYSLNGLYQFCRLYLLVRSKKVDIIHTFFEKSELFGWLIAKFTGIPVWITSFRDMGFKRNKIFRQIFKFSIRDCKKCVAVCNAVKEQMVLQEDVSPEKIDVIYNGLDLPVPSRTFEDNYLKKEINIDAKTALVGMVANFHHEIKGHIYFLEAAEIVLQKTLNVEFCIIGDGHLRSKYEQMASDLKIEQKIHFLGKRGDVAEILSSLDISVLSSISEGLSNAILESMAAAKPVVATRVGGNPEIIIEGSTGYLVQSEDSEALAEAIIKLLQDPEKAVTMGETGQKLIREKFTIKLMVNNYERLYSSLLSHCQ